MEMGRVEKVLITALVSIHSNLMYKNKTAEKNPGTTE
jgi:hypothetical protein